MLGIITSDTNISIRSVIEALLEKAKILVKACRLQDQLIKDAELASVLK